MDLSKLPRLSDSSSQTQPPPPPAGSASADAPPPAPHSTAVTPSPVYEYGTGPEIWISFAFGVLLLIIFPRLLTYLSSVLFHTDFAAYQMPDGTPVSYLSTLDFKSDLAITAYAVVLLLDALVMWRSRNRALIAVALVFTLLTTAGNLVYLVTTVSTQGIPIISAFAIIFGGYIAACQWRMLQSLRPTVASAG